MIAIYCFKPYNLGGLRANAGIQTSSWDHHGSNQVQIDGKKQQQRPNAGLMHLPFVSTTEKASESCSLRRVEVSVGSCFLSLSLSMRTLGREDSFLMRMLAF